MLAATIIASAALLALGLTHTAIWGDILPLGVLYVGFFMAIAWKHRTLAMFLIYGSALFPIDIFGQGGGAGLAIGAGEVHLAFVSLLLVFDFVIHRWPIPRSPLYITVVIYFAVCIISTVNHYQGTTAIVSIVQMFLYFIVTTAVFSNFVPHTEQHVRILHGIIVGGVVLALGVLITNSVSIWNMNKNGIGGALSYSMIVCAELWISAKEPRRRALLGLILLILIVGLFRTLSRGSWLCGITGVLFIIFIRGELGVIVKGLAIVTPIVGLFWFLLSDFDRSYIFGFSMKNQNISDRIKFIDIAQSIWEFHKWIGWGVGLRKNLDATNIVWLTLCETGILGLIGFALIHLTFFIMIFNARRRIPYDDPRFTPISVGGALVLGKFVHGCVDHYWSRGSLLVVWGAAGMAIAAYYSILNDERAKMEGMTK